MSMSIHIAPIVEGRIRVSDEDGFSLRRI